MKNRVIRACVITALVAGAAFGGVPPAHATHCEGPNYLDPKDPTRPQPQDYGFVTIDGLNVSVNPGAAPEYASAVLAWYGSIAGVAACETGAEAAAECVTAKIGEISESFRPADLYFRYVYQNESGGWSFAGDVVADDATHILTVCLPYPV